MASRQHRGAEPEGLGLRVVVRAHGRRIDALLGRPARAAGAFGLSRADFYATDYYTDKLIGYIDANRGDGKPFLALATYTSPHWPLQAPEAYIDRYAGRYDQGYEPIRRARIARQKRLGVIPWSFEPSPPLPASEIYAAMVENLDHNIGRIIRYLQRTGQYDDTFIFFQSDNGAEGVQHAPGPNDDNGYENLGRAGSYVCRLRERRRSATSRGGYGAKA